MIVGAIFQKPILSFAFGEFYKDSSINEEFTIWLRPAFLLSEYSIQINAPEADVVKISDYQYRVKYLSSGNKSIQATVISRNRKTKSVTSNSLTINVK